MNKLEDLWIDIKYYIEDHKWVKWAGLTFITGLLIIFGIGRLGKEEVVVTPPEDEQEVVDNTQSYDEVVGVSEETLHILTNPEEYSDDVVDRAFHDSLTTFDSKFVEDNVYLDVVLHNGVYLYHEKASQDFTEIAQLAQRVNEYGVPVYFYTPQNDQSIASISNHTAVLTNGEVDTYALVVKDNEIVDKITTTDGVVKYLKEVVDANNNE